MTEGAIDIEDFSDGPDPVVCECGEVEYWCEYCGYHGHECPGRAEPK